MSCGCGDTNRITIVRGNDTNFNGQNFVHLNITSSIWDLATMKATIALGGITKTFEDLSNGIDLSYTAAETSKMPFGDINGVLKIYNQEEQIATIESLLPFRVISVVHGNAIAVTPAEFNIEVKQGGETVMNIDVEAGVTVQVGTTTTLPAGSDATVTNSGTANHLVLDFGIPQGKKGEQGEQGEQGPVGPDGKDAKINGVNTLTLTATDGLALTQSGNVATLSGKAIQYSVTSEATNRQNADNNLQQQIDAITASSDVTDIVGTYAELQAYDTSGLAPNSIIKVLQDENRNDETTYYRWVITGGVGSWVLIGEEGPYYTKSEADGKFVPQTRTINGKALSDNISLTAGDVGAATSAQGAKADTAVQPNELGTAAYEDKTAFATAAQGTKADTAVQPATLNDYVTLNTAQEITATKTFKESTIYNGINVQRDSTTAGAFIAFSNNSGTIGAVGMVPNKVPVATSPGESTYSIVRGGVYTSPAVGDAATPVYVDSNGVAQPCTNVETKTTVVALADASTITLASNTIYNGGTLTALTIQLPSGVDNAFTSEIDFTSSTSPTTLSYPNTLKWIEGDDVSSQVFTPAANKRYICMIIWDGTQYVGTVRGVE